MWVIVTIPRYRHTSNAQADPASLWILLSFDCNNCNLASPRDLSPAPSNAHPTHTTQLTFPFCFASIELVRTGVRDIGRPSSRSSNTSTSFLTSGHRRRYLQHPPHRINTLQSRWRWTKKNPTSMTPSTRKATTTTAPTAAHPRPSYTTTSPSVKTMASSPACAASRPAWTPSWASRVRRSCASAPRTRSPSPGSSR